MKSNQFKWVALSLAMIVCSCVGVSLSARKKVVICDDVGIRWRNKHRELFNILQTLDVIRAGDVNQAVEMLEYSLDAAVIRSRKIRDELPLDDQEIVNRVLGYVSLYRNDNPRMVDVGYKSHDVRRNAYEEAAKVLDEYVGIGVSSGNKPDHIEGGYIVDDPQDRMNAIGIDCVYEELRYSYNQYIVMKDWHHAEIVLKRILDTIPNPNDARNVGAKKRLQEVQETGVSAILDR